MTITELTQKITESVLSDDSKQKILAVIQSHTEITPELEDQIKELIEEEIDKDLDELEEGDDDPELETAHNEHSAELEQIESELNEELAEVEQELRELDQVRADISKAEDAYKVMQLKNDLSAGS